MHPRSTRPARLAVLGSTLALMTLSPAAVMAQSDDAEMPAMAVEVAGLASGDAVTANRIDLTVSPVGYELSPDAGTPPVAGEGHYHVVLDGGLINMFTTTEASVSLQNVAPGPHTLMVVPAMNDHMPVTEGAAVIDFDYQPSDPLPEISATGEAAATPTVSVVSPSPGETVGDAFDLVVSTTDFKLSDELLGKPNVDGFGHWHVFVDAAEGMGTLMGMSGTDTITVSTAALDPGTHTFIAVLVDNLHAPFDPPVAAAVEVEVEGQDAAAASTGGNVAVSLQEWLLDPSDISLDAGSYTFVASNDGSLDHALVLTGDGIEVGTPDTAYPAGTSQSFTVDLAPGTYEVFCPVAGHKQSGMVGTITVDG